MFKNKRWVRAILISVMLLLGGLLVLPSTMNATTPDELDQNRARLLTYVLRRQVENHFSGKAIDDELSRAAFTFTSNSWTFRNDCCSQAKSSNLPFLRIVSMMR